MIDTDSITIDLPHGTDFLTINVHMQTEQDVRDVAEARGRQVYYLPHEGPDAHWLYASYRLGDGVELRLIAKAGS